MRSTLILLAALLPAAALATSAKAVVLYDGSSVPTAPDWTTFPPTIPHAFSNPGVTLDTTAALPLQGGFAYDTPTGLLSAATGFKVSFSSALLSESHNVEARAGFTAIIVTDTLAAVEFDFHPDKIYTQALDFTVAESVDFTTLPLTTYDVTISDTTYTLSTGNTTLLTGPLRPYAGSPNPGAIYYSIPGSLFFGDNTTNAAGTSLLTNVTVVPEPAALTLLPLAIPALIRRRTMRA